MDERQFTLPSTDGVTLGATLHGDPALAAHTILFAHGWTGYRDEAYGYFHRLAQMFGAAGMASLRFDARGHGKSRLPAGLPFRLAGFVDDIAACRAWVGTHYPQAQVSLFGLSLGGLAVLQTIAAAPQDYRCAVAAAPVVNGQNLTTTYPAEIGMLAPDLDLVTAASLAAALQPVAGRVMLVQGTLDDTCLAADARDLAARLPALRYLELPQMGHLFPAPDDEENSGSFAPRRPQSEANLLTVGDAVLAFIPGVPALG